MTTQALAGRKLSYSILVSLDGFINGPNGELDWHVVEEEFLQFVNEQQSTVDTFLFGRRMYEVMAYWDTAEQDKTLSEGDRAFARRWNQQEKIVFSSSLGSVRGNARLAEGTLEEEILNLKARDGSDIEIGGATLAAEAINLGLVDEYHLFVQPVLVGSGTRAFPAAPSQQRLQLVGSHSFRSGVIYHHYRRLDSESTRTDGVSA